MRALLDVNVVIALLDGDHASHDRATSWFEAHASDGWASCPITQNGCVRVMSHHAYPNALAPAMVIERLAEATSGEFHRFVPDDISLLDRRVIDSTRIHGARQLTDAYLLALALHHGCQLVTFDAAVPRAAVVGAKPDSLLVL